MRRQQWDRDLDRIHLPVSQRQHWRTHTDNGNAISTLAGDFIAAEEPAGVWLLRQLKGESRTVAEVVMDDALVQDDGIDLLMEELDRCWEVTQDQDKALKIEKAFFETQKYVKMVLRGTKEA